MSGPAIQQCVMLVGGLGTRLGDLTKDVPKPMLPVAGRPFVDHLLEKARRDGFSRVLLLAGFKADVFESHLDESGIAGRLGLEVVVAAEPEPLGTAGALAYAYDALDPAFVLMNGDTWFDFDWRALAQIETTPATMALRRVDPADRYETIDLAEDGQVRAIRPRDPHRGAALINGGAYRLERALLPRAVEKLSLEADVLPRLVARGLVGGRAFEGAFIDIGVPESYSAAQTLLAAPR